MTIERFNKYLKRIDRRLFITKANGEYQLWRSETRFFTWMFKGNPIRIGFRNKNRAAAHKMQIIPHLSMKAIKQMYLNDTRRFNVIDRLNANERKRKDHRKSILRKNVLLAGQYIHNRNKLTFIS